MTNQHGIRHQLSSPLSRLSRKQIWIGGTALIAVLIAAYSFYGVKVDAGVEQSGLNYKCGSDAPIMVTVHNYTFQRLAGARLTLEGWRDGRSKSILAKDRFYFDVVTGPFRTSEECFSDDAFAITKGNLGVPIPEKSFEETQEERHARIQKSVDADIEKNRLMKIVTNPTSTKYEKLDAMDKSMSLNESMYHTAKIEPKVEKEDLRIDLGKMFKEINELKRLTAGVKIIVKEVEPEFY